MIECPGATSLEFDVIIWWEGYLSYRRQNAKKTVISVASYCRAKRQIEKSIDQLVVSRQVLLEVWPDLREKMLSLGLPEQYAVDDRVLCIAITNIMEFTGYVRDGVVVTDDSYFFRFFDFGKMCLKAPAIPAIGKHTSSFLSVYGRHLIGRGGEERRF